MAADFDIWELDEFCKPDEMKDQGTFRKSAGLLATLAIFYVVQSGITGVFGGRMWYEVV